MTRMQAALVLTGGLLLCALCLVCAVAVVHDGTTPAPPASTTSP